MHQSHFLLGLRPRPAGGAYSAPRHLSLFKGPTSKGMEGNGRGGRKGKGEGRAEVERGIWPTQKFWCGAPYVRYVIMSKLETLRLSSDNIIHCFNCWSTLSST